MLCRYIIVMMRTSFDETIVKLYQEKQTTNDDDDDGSPSLFYFYFQLYLFDKVNRVGGSVLFHNDCCLPAPLHNKFGS